MTRNVGDVSPEHGARPGAPPANPAFAPTMRYALVNFVAIALLAAATLQGWTLQIYQADVTRLTTVIALVFLIGLVLCSHNLFLINQDLERCRRGDRPADSTIAAYMHDTRRADAAARATYAETLRMRLFGRISIVRYLANSLVVLGLIGTVIGFIIALSGVDPEIATNPSAVSPMVANLIEGMSVALYTTLVGAVLSVWLGLAFQMLSSVMRDLVATAIEHVERRALDPGAAELP